MSIVMKDKIIKRIKNKTFLISYYAKKYEKTIFRLATFKDKCVIEDDFITYLDLDRGEKYRRANGDWAIFDVDTKKLIATAKRGLI